LYQFLNSDKLYIASGRATPPPPTSEIVGARMASVTKQIFLFTSVMSIVISLLKTLIAYLKLFMFRALIAYLFTSQLVQQIWSGFHSCSKVIETHFAFEADF
jgi:hypothetical protein